jgi:hypothetical protein
MRVTTGRPTSSTSALSSYAHGPANGYFLIVPIRLTNIGRMGIAIDPTQFRLTTSSGRQLTVDSGNAPYSGASHVLDPTFLVRGGSEPGPLIYDTPQLHGQITYRPGGRPACTWTF